MKLMRAYALSTGSINEPDSHSLDSDLLKTEALGAILPVQDVPPFLLCPGCGSVYQTAYCLSCSHNVCRKCYEHEISNNRYMRCYICRTLVVSRPYLNSALELAARGYLASGSAQDRTYDVRQQYKIEDASRQEQDFGGVSCGPYFCGELALVCSKNILTLPATTEIERKTLCWIKVHSSLEVALVPRHRTQTAFMGLLFIYKGANVKHSAQLGALSIKLSITVVNQLPGKSRTYECVHTFSRGGGCYNIPIGPRSVLFDVEKDYISSTGTVTILVQASAFTTLAYDDAVLLSGAVQRLMVTTKRCSALDLEFLIDRSIAHDKADVAAHVARLLLELAANRYSVTSSLDGVHIQEYDSGFSVITLGFWLKESLSFTRLLKRAIRHIDTDDYDLIGAILGRHCLVFLESGGPSVAFDVTLKHGSLREEDLELACDIVGQNVEKNAQIARYEDDIRLLKTQLDTAEQTIKDHKAHVKAAEDANAKLEAMLKREITKASSLRRALTELVGTSSDILDHLLQQTGDQTAKNPHGKTQSTFIFPSGLCINGAISRTPKEISLFHKGYIELSCRTKADLPPVLCRLLRNTVLLDVRAVGRSPIALHLLLTILTARPTVRIRYSGSESIEDFVTPPAGYTSGDRTTAPDIEKTSTNVMLQRRDPIAPRCILKLTTPGRYDAAAEDDRPAVTLRAHAKQVAPPSKAQNSRSKRAYTIRLSFHRDLLGYFIGDSSSARFRL